MKQISTLLSHLLFICIAVGEPILSTFFQRAISQPTSADDSARLRYYKTMLIWQLAWVAALVVVLLPVANPLDAIGWRPLDRKGWTLTLVVALVMGIVLLMSRLARRLPGSPTIPKSRFAPQTRSERLFFALLVIVSAMCEPSIYLGFVWFYLGQLFPGLGTLFLVIVATLLLGTSQTNQGGTTVLETALTALAMALMFVYSGSLIVPTIFRILGGMRLLLYAEQPSS